ncbi:MAG: shikimate kinase [Anaerolineae bacterium]|nr:shikimate kinase [Anaerolineae bacterium]
MAIPSENLVITGFMGTGKSTIGKKIAAKLKREFVDTDAEIERRAGMSIPEIFEVQGEAAFRAMETELARELATREKLVISTGGGMLMNEENRALLGSNGFVVCLVASPEALEKRLQGARGRPLAAQWRELYEKRRPIYELLPVHVDTSDRMPTAVIQEILQRWLSSL